MDTHPFDKDPSQITKAEASEAQRQAGDNHRAGSMSTHLQSQADKNMHTVLTRADQGRGEGPDQGVGDVGMTGDVATDITVSAPTGEVTTGHIEVGGNEIPKPGTGRQPTKHQGGSGHV